MELTTIATVVFAAIAALLIVWYLVRRPPLTPATKLTLLAGLGVFPILAAGTGNVTGFHATTTVDFCDSCHVMYPYVNDARDVKSNSLAAIHTRNPHFGGASCYTCHEDYGMFGTVNTKIEGTRHLWAYYTKYRTADPETADIKLYKPFSNNTCRQCHSLTAPGWLDEPEHQTVLEDVKTDAVSCYSEGCHGPAHAVKGRSGS